MLPGGAALFHPPSARGFVLIDDGAVARFGAALLWADRVGAQFLDVLVDGSPSAPGVVARRARCFASPAIAVWSVSGTSLEAATPAPIVGEVGTPDPSTVGLLESVGLEVVWEHGVLRGEVLGLEVARTVGDHLEIGVGRHDRSARSEMRPAEDLASGLAEAAAVVRELRRPEAPPHPANTLARSRWLRTIVCRSPELFGFSRLAPVSPPLPWFDLPEAMSAPCVGSTSSGAPAVVVCSVGVDPDLVPSAADARLHHAPDAELWLVLPEGDDLPVTHRLAERVLPPASLATVARGWASI